MMEGLATAGSFGPAGYFSHGHRRAIQGILGIIAAIALISVLPRPGVGFGSVPAHLGGPHAGGAQAGQHGRLSAGQSDGAMTLAQAPESLQRAVAEALESDVYAVTAAEPGPGEPTLRANNPAHGFVSIFAPSGVSITPAVGDHWRWDLTTTAYGHPGLMRAVKAASPVSSKDRVLYRRGPITEWYLNTPQGLEQGFTVAAPPPGRADGGPFLLRLSSSGTLVPRLEGDAVTLALPGAAPTLTYSKLLVTDAEGRRIPSRLGVRGSSIVVVVNDAASRYPLTIDPVVAEQQKLTASDAAASDLFGSSVAVSGDTAVVGAYSDDTPAGLFAGSAYVFVRSGTTWTEQQKLTASDGAAGDTFGASVAVDGNTAVVGAYLDDAPAGTNAGSAYVFVRSGTTWTEQQKLTSSDGAAEDFFGASVGLVGDTAVVGAYRDDNPAGFDAGSAYVYVRSGTTWTQQQKLTASDGAANDWFGISVALSGDTAVVGAYRDDNPAGTDAGSAYVFVRSGTTWTQQQKLTASDSAAGDNFGYSVALSGDTAVVGATLDDIPAGADAGSAYVFVRSGTTWTQQQKLTASDGAASDRFGISVAVSGDTAVVGAYLDNIPGGTDAGSAYAFVRSGTIWTQHQRLTAFDGAGGDLFGASVALDGDTAVVGALNDDTDAGIDAGSAYVFELGILSAPVIESFTPPSGVVGKAVTVLGTGFTGATEVDFNGVPASFTVVSDSQIDTSVPHGALTGPITVTTPGGSDTSEVAFKVKPKVKRFIPTSGPVGTQVSITGTAFTGATRVQFNGVNAAYTVDSYTQITATVPAGATTGFITVVTPGGKGKSKTVFTVT